jgi:hypothetical protein
VNLLIEMDATDLIKSLAAATRAWRERAFRNLQDEGCNDLSYRPRSGMSSVGWILAHQAAAYDYTLNMLIKDNPPKNPDLFFAYRGDSSDKGDWKGTSIQEINDYFDLTEKDLLAWSEQATDEELNRILEGPGTPQYYQGKRVIDALGDTFAHLNHHNGHLSSIKGDWSQ